MRELTQAVVAQLGALDGGRFVAVHVRRGDRLRQYPARLTEPAHIRECLRRWEVPDGSVLFIMSDERKPDFFQPLQEHYRLFRHVDFPRLLSLLSADDTLPDNYLLYQVEQEVTRSAWLCLDTLPKSMPSSDMQGFLVSEADWTRDGMTARELLTRRLKQTGAILSRPVMVKDIGVALARRQFGAVRHLARATTGPSDRHAEKVISSKYRFLCICNHKVGSRSLKVVVLRVDPAVEDLHGKSIAEIYALRPEVKDYFSFAFIRHPFDRALSLYSEIYLPPQRYPGMQRWYRERKREHFFLRFHGLKEVGSFDDYCRWLNTPFGSDAFADRNFLSQHVQIRLPDGRLPDFIGRLENLEENLKQVASRLGVRVPAVPMLNTMAGWEAPSPDALKAARATMAAHLTEENRALLSARYAEDLELYRQVEQREGK